jgi:calcineurin-like phosphoesterase family protein
MNTEIVKRHNALVDPRDVVYVLGDVCLGGTAQCIKWVSQLNGRLKILLGDHDATIRNACRGNRLPNVEVLYSYLTTNVFPIVEVNIEGQGAILSHWAAKVWRRKHYGSWMLYAHSHGKLPDEPASLTMDVGVDTNDFKPYSWEDIKEIMFIKKMKQEK